MHRKGYSILPDLQNCSLTFRSSFLCQRYTYIKLSTIIEGDPKAPFSIATTSMCVSEGATPFFGLLHFPLILTLNAVKQGGIKYHFWVFGMTRPRIEPRSSRPLANSTHFIYIIHRQTFVVSQLFTMARHVGRLKLGSKSAHLYVRLSIIPLSQQANHVSSGIIKALCSSFRFVYIFALPDIYTHTLMAKLELSH